MDWPNILRRTFWNLVWKTRIFVSVTTLFRVPRFSHSHHQTLFFRCFSLQMTPKFGPPHATGRGQQDCALICAQVTLSTSRNLDSPFVVDPPFHHFRRRRRRRPRRPTTIAFMAKRRRKKKHEALCFAPTIDAHQVILRQPLYCI